MKSKLWQHLETDITETRESLAVPTGGCSALSFNTTKWQPILYVGNVSDSDAGCVLFLYQDTARFKARWDRWDYMVGLSMWYWLQLSLCSQPGNSGDFMECEMWELICCEGIGSKAGGLRAGTTLSVLFIQSTALLQSYILKKICQVDFSPCFRNCILKAYWPLFEWMQMYSNMLSKCIRSKW